MAEERNSTLVTGGAGYIGSHTVRALRDIGRNVVVLDSLETGTRDAVGDTPLIVGDLRTPGLVESVCREHDVTQIVHFAAYKSVGESMSDPGRYWRNNVAGAIDLIEAALAADVQQMVFSSSCSVYGTPAETPVSEEAPIEPESVYAETKAMVERMLNWYDTTRGFRSVSLRYFNAAGASFDGSIGENWEHSTNLIPLVMRALLEPKATLQVYGDDYPTPDGTAIRDYIHVVDLADAHVKALEYLAGGGTTEAINVGTGVGSSVLDVIRSAERVAERPVPYEIISRREGDPTATYADPRRCDDVLGWSAEHSLDDAVSSAYRWHAQSLTGSTSS